MPRNYFNLMKKKNSQKAVVLRKMNTKLTSRRSPRVDIVTNFIQIIIVKLIHSPTNFKRIISSQ